MDSTGLLLIDIQNDYFPRGKMELKGSEEAGRIAGQLLGFFRARRRPVIHIQHVSIRQGATFFLPDTTGVEIHASVKPADSEVVIQKHFPNSFLETDLLAHLQRHNLRRLVIAGMMTDMCLDAGVRAAADHGYECWIAADGCATRDLSFGQRVVKAADVQAAFLAALHGSYGEVMTAADVINRLG
jgi:nicotinamidase-related amidase